MWIIGFIIGVCIGVGITLLIKNNPIQKKKYLRRGIISRGYTQTKSGEETDYNVQIELAEIERTKTKSKVIALSIIPNGSKFNTEKNKRSIRGLFDNIWIESNSIEWIQQTKEDQREEKLKIILDK